MHQPADGVAAHPQSSSDVALGVASGDQSPKAANGTDRVDVIAVGRDGGRDLGRLDREQLLGDVARRIVTVGADRPGRALSSRGRS
ncbi:hypothetical protein GS928_23670 [Rhodococcus hoagii]|nr:hypothetical protein [Prescottella equi]